MLWQHDKKLLTTLRLFKDLRTDFWSRHLLYNDWVAIIPKTLMKILRIQRPTSMTPYVFPSWKLEKNRVNRGGPTWWAWWAFAHSVFQRSEAKPPSKLQNSCNLYVPTTDVVRNRGLAHPVFTRLRRPCFIHTQLSDSHSKRSQNRSPFQKPKGALHPI